MQRGLVWAAVGSIALLYACFSDRPGQVTGPADGNCNIALDSPVIGEPGVILAMNNFQFLPGELRIPRGTRVTWVNCESTVLDFHTATSDTGIWDSPEMLQGESFSRVFDLPGRFPYHCVPHEPFMTGVIIVE
ncbi:MAG: plastocyanin/azurin family copper-binding protein [Longimicrobiales bacterium]